MSASFEPIGLWFLAPIAYLLFFKGLKRSSHPVLFTFIFAFISHLLILQWSGKYVGVLPWLALTLLQTLFYLPIGLFFRRFKSIIALVPLILALEEVRARFPFDGFGWTRIAFSQSNAPYIHLVSIGGVLLVSAIVLFTAALLETITWRRLALVSFIVISPVFLFHPASSMNNLEVIGVQGNTPVAGIGFNDRAMAVFDLHASETVARVKKKYDLIVWPENAVDVDPTTNKKVGDELTRLAREFKTPLIVGAVLNSRGSLENTSILYSANGKISSIYVKRHLTPFGEYMPLRSLAEFLSPYANLVNDFSPGDKRVTHRVKGYELGPIICYELIDDGLVRDMARHSNALIVQTNSATFAGTAEGRQQLAITRIRAIEHAREILSISTVGPSAMISYDATIRSLSDENVSSQIEGSLEMREDKTISSNLGGVAPLLVLFISSVLAMRFRRTLR